MHPFNSPETETSGKKRSMCICNWISSLFTDSFLWSRPAIAKDSRRNDTNAQIYIVWDYYVRRLNSELLSMTVENSIISDQPIICRRNNRPTVGECIINAPLIIDNTYFSFYVKHVHVIVCYLDIFWIRSQWRF